MFTIDLLKGYGVPARSRPEYIVISMVTLIVPIVVALIMLGCYLANSITTSVQKQKVNVLSARIDDLSEAVSTYEKFEGDKKTCRAGISEVANSIDQYSQWSPVLVEIAENIPDSVILTRLEVSKGFVKKKVPKEGGIAGEMVNVSVRVRTLQLDVCGDPGTDYDQAVKDFKQALADSTLLGPKLQDIVVSQDLDKLGGQEVALYSIDCIFKPGL